MKAWMQAVKDSEIQMNLLDVKAELKLFAGFYHQPALPSYEI